ncbi:OPT oligopeptide transporter protein-domain-containing protein [Umbelopsis sp. AD052]|nr:OPT oligopeptide transporter protein-domain-containing protein [Umbelopsis sp. AD052]
MVSERLTDTTTDDKRGSEDALESLSVKSTKEDLAYSPEKEPSLTSGDDEEKIEQVAEAEGLPVIVREIVSLEDRPEDLTITFRFFLLGVSFSVLGAFITQLSWFRTTSAPFSILFVQVATHWLGHWLAKILPDWTIGVGKYSFSLNPGPFSLKEHVLITLCVASGSQNNLGEIAIATADIFFERVYHPAAAIFFMISAITLSYSFACIARNFLIYEPEFIFPQALMQTQLFRTLRKDTFDKSAASKQLRIFAIVAVGIYLWEFLPEYIFPFLSSLAVICWFAPHNPTAKFVGSGIGGMGFLNFSLDWANFSNSTGSVYLMPWWTQVITFTSFVVTMWIIVPIIHFKGLWNADIIPIFSQALWTTEGKTYNVTQIISVPSYTFNETAYAIQGPVRISPYYMLTIFASYASYISVFVYIVLFAGPKLLATFKQLRQRDSRASRSDKLSQIMSKYPEVPLLWWAILFVLSFVTILITIIEGGFGVPIWTFVVAVLFGALCVVPMGYIFAISNYQVQVGVFNELLFGYMAPGLHPTVSLFYRCIAAETWYRAQSILLDMKLGHYMMIPPRLVFFSQVFGTFLGSPINYAVIRWVVNSKRPYLDGTLTDPNGQYSGQAAKSYYTSSTQYGLIGPKILFADSTYTPLLYGFLVGAVSPMILYILHRRFPKARFDLWNVTIFFGGVSNWWGNLSTGPLSSIIVGFFSQFYLFRYRHEIWRKYNYLVGSALDTGFNLAVLSIFIFFSAGKQVKMPTWWGNDPGSIEKCYGK